MTAEKKIMYGLDPSKYPSRLGQPWDDDEILKLLVSIQKKKSIEDIAKEHDRTEGGIKCYINKLATDYHFNDKRPIEEIQQYTGLSKEEIEKAIKKREVKETIKKSTGAVIKQKKLTASITDADEDEPTMKEVVVLLKDIQGKLNALLEKVA